MRYPPFYDPEKTLEENYAHGPYGPFADGQVYKDEGEPTADYLGHKIYVPFGIAAGPLYNDRFVKAALDKGFNLVTHKTVRTGKFKSNPFPNILGLPKINGDLKFEDAEKGILATNEYQEPLNILNSFNNPSYEPEVWQKDLHDILSHLRKGQVLSCSIEPLPNSDPDAFIEDWVYGAKLIKETGVDIIELNTSCPNAGKTDLLCFDINRMKTIVEKVKNAIGDAKLIIKLAYFQDESKLEELIRAIGGSIDAVAAINTISAKIIDEKGNLKLTGGRERAGVSGDSIRYLGLETTRRLKSIREKYNLDYTIIGIGGVMSPKHYFEYRESGADAVMGITGILWNPYLAQEIKEAIKKDK